MTHLMPRRIRYALSLGVLLLLAALVVAPAAGAIPKDGPPVPTPPPAPTATPTPFPDHLPDLAVESISHGYLPYLGYYIEAMIRNQSNNDILDPFYVRDDSSWNKTVRVTTPMAGGSSVKVRFYRYNCAAIGTVHADAFRQIPESVESNNSRFWVRFYC